MNYSINNNHNTERTFYARLYFVYAENMLMTESEASDYACNHGDDDDPMAALIAAGDMSMWTFDEVAQYVANSREQIDVTDNAKKFLAVVNVYKTAKYYYKHWDTRHELYMYTDDGFKLAIAEAEAYNDEHADQMDVFEVVVCVPIFERLRTNYAWRDGAESPVEYDLGNPFGDNEHGITLITLDEAYREQMEPGAASCADRLTALRALHDAGCKTWVSIEPYPTPNMISQDLNEILEAVAFTDRIIFGRTNYSKVANSYEEHKHFYNECAAEVITFCQEHGIEYHIKEKTISGWYLQNICQQDEAFFKELEERRKNNQRKDANND